MCVCVKLVGLPLLAVLSDCNNLGGVFVRISSSI